MNNSKDKTSFELHYWKNLDDSEIEVSPYQDPRMVTVKVKCNLCTTVFFGTRYQKWCGKCKERIHNSYYWEEYW